MNTKKISDFSQIAINVIKYFFYVVIICLSIYFVISQIVLPDERDDLSGSFTEFNEGWTRVLPNGNTVPVEIPGGFDAKPGELTAISNILPDDTTLLSSICIQSGWQDINIYINNELRESYNTKDSRPFGENSTIRYIFADLSPEDAGKTVTIEAVTTTPYSGNFQTIYIGDKSSMWLNIFNTNGFKSILEFTMIIISLIYILFCVFMGIVYHQKVELGFLGWVVLLCSLWLFSETKFRQLLFPNISALSGITFWSLMLIPFPTLLYMNELQKGRYKAAYSIALIYNCFVFIINTILQIFNIVDFRNSLTAVHVGVIMSVLMVAVCIFIDIKRKLFKDYYLVSFGILGIIVGAMFEIILFYTTPKTTLGTSIAFGLIFLLAMATLKTAQDYLRTKQEQQRAILANEAKAQFLANMSHEIRTPINAVIGMNDMILRENKDPVIQEYASNIQASSKMLLGLINDILDLSKIESGQMTLFEDSYQLASLIIDELNLLEMRAKKKNLEIILDIEDRLPSELHGDELRIKQIITNLLTNAVKYTEKGSITLSLKAKWLDCNLIVLCISVSDTGIGIKENDLEKLFDSFSRFDEKKNRNIEGTGLGLNITQMLVKLMQGEIKVTSEYGKGSTFSVEIPQKVLNVKAIGDIQKAYKRARQNAQIQKRLFVAPDAHILVVDDNDINLSVIKGLLKRNCVQLDMATSGKECLKLTKEKKYDVILMDHMMPDLDGVETLQLLKNDNTNINQNTTVIALTANAISGSRELYIGYGFNDYLSKPVESRKLEELLLKHLPGKLVSLDTENSDYIAIPDVNTDASTKQANTTTNNTHNNFTTVNIINNSVNNTFIRNNTNNTSNQSDITVIDYDSGLSLCNDSKELYHEILEMFYNNHIPYIKQLKDYYNTKDFEGYQRLAHTIKSNAKNIGAENFAKKALIQEKAVKEGDINFIENTLDEFCSQYTQLADTIPNLISSAES